MRRGAALAAFAALLVATAVLLATTALAAEPATETATKPAPAPVAAEPALPVDGTPFFVALSVASADASAAWYERVLGFEVVRRQTFEEQGVSIAILRRGDALLELVDHPEARALGDLEPPVERTYLVHGIFKFGFLVPDLDAVIARLETLEVPLRGRIIEEGDGSFRSLQVVDPDGNFIQIFERLKGAAPEAAASLS